MKLLTLNISAFPCIFNIAGVMTNGGKRSSEIANIIKTEKYDIIMFQEVWSRDAYDRLVDVLSMTLPYYTKFDDSR